MIKISVDQASERGLLRTLQAMTLTKKRRKRVLQNAAKGSVNTSRRNQRTQKTPQGKRWQKRANKGRKKMQIRLARLLTMTRNDGQVAQISWRKRVSATIAAKHHDGHQQKHTRASAIKELRNGHQSAS
ncbi:hypothetical protein ACB087_01235 [Vibrio sp. VNB-15]